MKAIAASVRRMYTANPFPPPQRRGSYRAHAAYFRRKLQELKGRDLRGLEVADMGCGTCAMLADHALAMPEARFTGFDLTPRSLKVGAEYLRGLGLANVRLRRQDLMALRLKPTFDAIYTWGVVHHLPSSREGIRRIAAALKPGGILRVGVYNATGNLERGIQREIAGLLGKGARGRGEHLGRLRAWLKSDPGYSPRHTCPPVDLDDDDWMVDEFLHVWEKPIGLAVLAGWLGEEDLDLVEMTDYENRGIPLDPAGHLRARSLAPAVRRLGLQDRLRLVELLERPYWTAVLARKRGG